MTGRNARFGYLLVVAVLLLSCSLALAQQQQSAGRVTVVLGTVEAVADDGTVRELQRGDSVYEGELLRSGRAGRAQIRFTDRGLLSLRPDTELRIDEYAFDDAEPEAGEQSLELDRGGFRKQTGRIAEANREGYRVQTPVGVIGVRGTTYDTFQESGGGLLVGVSEGAVEVVSSTGAVGRIGTGQDYDFLRVQPDGSIEFLLEAPEQFTVSPELDEGSDDGNDEGDDGSTVDDAASARATTGEGDAETTAGTPTVTRTDPVNVTGDPESGGDVAPSQDGQGEPPTVTPIVEPLLSADERAALLEDNRLALTAGLPAVAGEEDEASLGEQQLAGGLGTRGEGRAALAFDPTQGGFPTALTTQSRETLLAESGRFLVDTEAAPIDWTAAVGDVDGLDWGRLRAPASMFLDADNRERSLALERDVLFALGTPSSIAELTGVHDFSLVDSQTATVDGGLPVAGVTGSGVLDLAEGGYQGELGVDFGDSDALSHRLASSFTSQVDAGVLTEIETAAEFLDLGAERSAEAAAEIAGFFTGAEADHLQLAFDFRVPSRDDADVAGLALLRGERRPDPEPEPEPEPVFSDSQRQSLLEDNRLGMATGIPEIIVADDGSLTLGETGLGRGIGSQNSPPLLALSQEAAFGGSDRSDALADASVLLLNDSGEVTDLQEDLAGVEGLVWGRFAQPVSLYVDQDDASTTLPLERDVLFALGTPSSIAELTGVHDFSLVESQTAAAEGALPVAGVTGSGVLDLAEGGYQGELGVDFGDGDALSHRLTAIFQSQVNDGVLAEFSTFAEFLDLSAETSTEADAELAGFFTGADARFLQMAFDFSVPERDDADVSRLALLQRQPRPDPLLSSGEQTALTEGSRVALGLAPALEREGDSVTFGTRRVAAGLAATTEGGAALAFDDQASGFSGGQLLSERETALAEAGLFLLEGQTAGVDWQRSKGGLEGLDWGRFQTPGPAFVDADDRDQQLQLDDSLLFAMGTPTDVADLTGIYEYELLEQEVDTGGMEVVEATLGGTLDMQEALFTGGLDFQLHDAEVAEGGDFRLTGDFAAAVAQGVLQGVDWSQLALTDLQSETQAEAAGDLSGFFTGDQGRLLQLAFDLEVPSERRAAVRGLALLEQFVPENNLSPDELEQLFAGYAFGGVSCCFASASTDAPVLSGRASDPTEVTPGEIVLGLDDDSISRFVRREGADYEQVGGELPEGLTALSWYGSEFPPRVYERASGTVIRELSEDLMLVIGQPVSPATLSGAARFELETLLDSRVEDLQGSSRTHFSDAGISLNLDFSDGRIRDGRVAAWLDDTTLIGGEPSTDGPRAPHFVAAFQGQLAVDTEMPLAEMEVLGGALVGPEGSEDPVVTERSQVTGFLSGAEGDRFASAFYFETEGQMEGDGSNPLALAGTALLRGHDLRLQQDEAAALADSGLLYAGASCCGDGGGSTVGRAAGPGPDTLLGHYEDVFGSGMPSHIIRRAGAADQVLEMPELASDADLQWSIWFDSPAGSPLYVDAETGYFESLGNFVLYQTATPSSLDALAATGFATFGSRLGETAVQTAALGFFSTGEEMPGEGGTLQGFEGSFNADLSSGAIHNGYLLVADEAATEGSPAAGFEVFFDGQLQVLDSGDHRAALDIQEGRYHDRTPIDLEQSELSGFFAGEEAPLFAGAYSLYAGDVHGSGVFAFPELVERRLDAEQAAALDRMGLAAFGSGGYGSDVRGGVLMGRAEAANGQRLLLAGDYAEPRNRPWAQPAPLVLRDGDGDFGLVFDSASLQTDVVPDGGPSFEGFEVGWGHWRHMEYDGRIYEDPSDEQAFAGVSTDVLFASVTPTPVSALPTTGTFQFDGPAASLGADLQELSVAFDLDFATGTIRDGAIAVQTGAAESVNQWQGAFEGQLKGAVTELQLQSLSYKQGVYDPVDGDLEMSRLSGVLTGPEGERHVGAFHLRSSNSDFHDEVQGMWVIDGAEITP